MRRTRAGGWWVVLAAAAFMLLLLLIFVLQNGGSVRVSFMARTNLRLGHCRCRSRQRQVC